MSLYILCDTRMCETRSPQGTNLASLYERKWCLMTLQDPEVTELSKMDTIFTQTKITLHWRKWSYLTTKNMFCLQQNAIVETSDSYCIICIVGVSPLQRWYDITGDQAVLSWCHLHPACWWNRPWFCWATKGQKFDDSAICMDRSSTFLKVGVGNLYLQSKNS